MNIFTSLIYELLYAVILFVWVAAVVLLVSKRFYEAIVDRVSHSVAVYYNRKLIHILTGALVAVLVPYLFTTPILPFIFSIVLAVFTYLPHRRGKLFYWFQTRDNVYEAHFCITWGLTIALAWIVFRNYWFGIVPVLFMAVGDGVTGIVRNMLFKRRTKSWWGNLAMLTVTLPIGAVFGYAGIIASIICSVIEHFEWRFIDDNVTVPLTAFLIVYLFNTYCPKTLTV